MKLGGNEVGCVGRLDIWAIKFSLNTLVVELSFHALLMIGDVGELLALDVGVPRRGGKG